MASFDFPTSPVEGQTYTLNGVTYYYSSAIGAWLTNLVMNPINANTVNTQIIFNDGGYSNGSTGLIFNRFSNTFTTNNATINGNLGVGTASPTEKLHVKGNILAENGASAGPSQRNVGHTLWTDDAFGSELHYGGGSSNNQSVAWATAVYGRRSDGIALRLGAYAANETLQGNFYEYVTIKNDVKVGIFNTSPATNLHVSGDSTSVATAPFGDFQNNGQFFISGKTNSTQRLAMGVDTSGTMFGVIQAMEAGVVARALSLNPSGGNVGIANTAPGHKLSISGTSYFGGVMSILAATWHTSTDGIQRFYYGSNGRSYYKSGDGSFEFRNSSDAGYLNLLPPASGFVLSANAFSLATTTGSQAKYLSLFSTDGNVDYLEITNTRMRDGTSWESAGSRIQQKVDATYMGYIQFNGGNLGANNSYGISFGTGSSATANGVSERMRIDASGNVGIGVTSTAYKLDVNGTVNAASVLINTKPAATTGKAIAMAIVFS